MESYFYRCKPAFKSIVIFALLFWALLFTSPASATSREVNNTLPNVAPVQLAYYGGYYHWHRWHHGYRWHRWHHGYRWHHWRHWRR
jgi:hypothetical protein